MEKVGQTEVTDEAQVVPLPWIGHRPVRAQMSILLTVTIISAALFVVVASWLSRAPAGMPNCVPFPQKCRMLSQRLAVA